MSRLLAMLAVSVALAGCAGYQPMEVAEIDEIPQGPGLFSGADGAFVLFGAPVKDDTSGDE